MSGCGTVVQLPTGVLSFRSVIPSLWIAYGTKQEPHMCGCVNIMVICLEYLMLMTEDTRNALVPDKDSVSTRFPYLVTVLVLDVFLFINIIIYSPFSFLFCNCIDARHYFFKSSSYYNSV